MVNVWDSFGWDTYEIDGHDTDEFLSTVSGMSFDLTSKPKVIIANTTKGKGVSFIEGHGPWHHRIPSAEDMANITRELS